MATDDTEGDRFLVGIHVTDSQLEFVVRVPSEIDSRWRDPEAFQQLVAEETWSHLDQESTLRAIAATGSPGDTVRLGTVTLHPDGTLVSHELSMPPSVDEDRDESRDESRDEDDPEQPTD